jgi:Ca-activated chloride channel family protein
MNLNLLNFAYPWALILPVLLALSLLRRSRVTSLPIAPEVKALRACNLSYKAKLRAFVLFSLLSIAVLLLSFAAARPQIVRELEEEENGRDLFLSLDISGSMRENDFASGAFYINRLEAVKQVTSEFINSRKQDRIGVAVFGSHAYLQAPLTRDHKLVTQLISRLSVGIAGDGTAIGDGIGVALKRLEQIDGYSKAIILLTDGANNSGQVNPIQAAKIAEQLKIKIHTIGIGRNAKSGTQYGLPQSVAEYDETTLKEIAKVTGGVFFNADNLAELKKVYAEIDQLETREQLATPKQEVRELFIDYSFFGIFALASYLILSRSIFIRLS